MKVDHFAFLVNDMDVAIDFYSNKLGMKLMFRQKDEEHQEEFAFLELEGGNLELLRKLDRPTSPINIISPKERSNAPHLALVEDDLEKFVEELKSKDIDILEGPLLIPDQVKWMYLADPDGNIIEFVQWLNKK